MARALPEWLLQKPSEGLAADFDRRQLDLNGRRPGILDMAAVLYSDLYAPEGLNNVSFTIERAPIEIPDERINQLWQKQTEQLRGNHERIDPKTHLRSFLAGTRGLTFVGVTSDWALMSLGPMLRDGRLPDNESYRDQIMPIERTTQNGTDFEFNSPLPNHAVLQLAVITADDHLILTTRSSNVAFEQRSVSATVEQHINPEFQKPLHETINSAVSKLESSELKLTMLPETLSLKAVMIEPNVNNTGIVVIGRCQETSSQIGAAVIGEKRRSEFDSSLDSVRTIPLDDPKIWVPRFVNPGFQLHGVSRIRWILAAQAVMGDDALELLHYEYLNTA